MYIIEVTSNLCLRLYIVNQHIAAANYVGCN